MLPGQAEREEALERVERGASDAWLLAAGWAVEWCARSMPNFTTDDVWAALPDPMRVVGEPRAMGAVMRKAASDGLVEPTDGYRQSIRPECHRRPLRVWRKLQEAR